jgi:hypothetical protein
VSRAPAGDPRPKSLPGNDLRWVEPTEAGQFPEAAPLGGCT